MDLPIRRADFGRKLLAVLEIAEVDDCLLECSCVMVEMQQNELGQ